MVIKASLIVASIYGKKNWAEGYNWVHSHIKGTCESLANPIENKQVVKNIKMEEFDYTIQLMNSFDKKEYEVRAIAETNLLILNNIERNFNTQSQFIYCQGTSQERKLIIYKEKLQNIQIKCFRSHWYPGDFFKQYITWG